MFRKSISIIVALLFISATAFAGKAEDIIKKYADARGDMTKIENYKSVKMTMVQSAMGMSANLTIMAKADDKIRTEQSSMGQLQVAGTNGTDGWVSHMNQVKPIPHKQIASQTKAMLDLFILGPILTEQAGDTKLTYAYKGKVNEDGRSAYKVIMTAVQNGQPFDLHCYFDSKDYILYKSVTNVKVKGVERKLELLMDNYKKFEGALIPTKLTMKESTQSTVMELKTIEFNIKLDDKIFEKPTK